MTPSSDPLPTDLAAAHEIIVAQREMLRLALDNAGFRVWIDWARNAVKTNKAELQKQSADIFQIARPMLDDWGKELIRGWNSAGNKGFRPARHDPKSGRSAPKRLAA